MTETKVGIDFPVIDPTKGDPGAGVDPHPNRVSTSIVSSPRSSFLPSTLLPFNQFSLSSLCGLGNAHCAFHNIREMTQVPQPEDTGMTSNGKCSTPLPLALRSFIIGDNEPTYVEMGDVEKADVGE